MTDTTDPNRYADTAFREKARKTADLLGEPGATELRAALGTIDKMEAGIGAVVSELDSWLENPDPAEASDELLRVYRELKELADG